MKVVLFCGGLGTRLREYSDTIPKPLAPIGDRPIIWHLMRYYAHFGHTDFVLCLGYGGHLIRTFFDGAAASCGGWRVNFVESSAESTIGERLRAAEPLVRGEPVFLANYADGLTDLHLPALTDAFLARPAVAGFVASRIAQSYHVVTLDDTGLVTALTPAASADVWINGGFFVFRRSIFDYVRPGEDLVDGTFPRLLRDGLLFGYPHHGFWAALDTYKDKVRLDRLAADGQAPWAVWSRPAPALPNTDA